MPSHPPHRPSRTTPIQTHRPSLASNRARKRSAVPTRFSGAHKCTHSGPPPASQPKSSAPLPCCQLARTGAAPPRGPGSTTPHPNWRLGTGLGHPVPGTTAPQATLGPGWATRHRPSPPLPSNAANWQRAGHIEIAPPCHPGPPSRPQRQRPTSGPPSQLAKGLGRREPAIEHL